MHFFNQYAQFVEVELVYAYAVAADEVALHRGFEHFEDGVDELVQQRNAGIWESSVPANGYNCHKRSIRLVLDKSLSFRVGGFIWIFSLCCFISRFDST